MASIVVSAAVHDLSDDPANGFVTRHADMIDWLSERHDVALVAVRAESDRSTLSPRWARLTCREVSLPSGTGPRWRSLLRRSVRDPVQAWEQELVAAAEEARPDAVLTVGPWLDVEFRSLWRRPATGRSVHLLEEDITPRLRGGRPASRREQWARRVSDASKRRAGMTPDRVVVISPTEVESAQRRFPRAQVLVIPRTLDGGSWPVATSASEGERVVVVANLSELRNADGLAQVLAALQGIQPDPPVPVRLVSGAGVHPVLVPYLDLPWLELAAPVGDVREEYASARVAVVPALHATGFKTTILEAWTAGCPVLCLPASAATLGPSGMSAVRVVESPHQLADAVVDLYHDAEARELLSSLGIRVARREHDHALAMDRLERALLGGG